jgi:predicted transposase YbfD/YdcC
MEIKESLDIYFSLVDDTRNQSYITYKLSDILFLLVCGMICGCKELQEIIELGEERIEFFNKHTSLEEIPCLMTLVNILNVVKPERLELCLYGIFRNVFKRKVKPKEKQICIDGKTISSTAKMKEYDRPIHVITALLADNCVSLGQIVVESKENEITAVRELIDMIDIKETVVTMDAMHCQKETVAKIVKNKGDYVVQLKANQGNFYQDVYTMFDDNYMDTADKDSEYETYTTIEKSHGRLEKRTCYVLNEVEFFTDYLAEWKGLKKIFAVKREVEINGNKSKEISCYLSSKNTSAEKLLSYTRKHWQIESFNWMLDMNFGEDDSRVRNRNIQICLSIVRKFSISILKNYIDNNDVKRKAVSSNMRKCLLNPDYLTSVLEYYCSNIT